MVKFTIMTAAMTALSTWSYLTLVKLAPEVPNMEVTVQIVTVPGTGQLLAEGEFDGQGG